MQHRIVDRWNQKSDWFRDHSQANDVATVILHRLADDRNEDECRYLLRLKWHFHMPYQEVSYDELQCHVSPIKMDVLDCLFDAIAGNAYDAIDAWVTECGRRLPIIEDKWINENREADYVRDLLDGQS